MGNLHAGWAGGLRTVAVALTLSALPGCGESNPPTSPTPPTVRVVFEGSTTRRSDLPASAQPCVEGVGATHIHPSWRGFAAIPLTPVPPGRYEITFTDAPLDTRLSFRVNDQNACDENPTGAVTRNVFVNGTRLVQNTTTPGNGDEPGYAFQSARRASSRSSDAAIGQAVACGASLDGPSARRMHSDGDVSKQLTGSWHGRR